MHKARTEHENKETDLDSYFPVRHAWSSPTKVGSHRGPAGDFELFRRAGTTALVEHLAVGSIHHLHTRKGAATTTQPHRSHHTTATSQSPHHSQQATASERASAQPLSRHLGHYYASTVGRGGKQREGWGVGKVGEHARLRATRRERDSRLSAEA